MLTASPPCNIPAHCWHTGSSPSCSNSNPPAGTSSPLNTRDLTSMSRQLLDLIACSKAATNFGFPFFTFFADTWSWLSSQICQHIPVKKRYSFTLPSEGSQPLQRGGRAGVKNLISALICKKTNLDNSILNLADSGILLSTTGLTAQCDVMKRLHLGWT